MRRRSSNWLQKGCRTVIPVLRLGIHPEMERPAILKRSMPSTAGVTIGIPPARVGNEEDFQLQEEYTRRGAVSPGTFVPVLMSEGKCLHWRAKSAHLGGHLPRGRLQKYRAGTLLPWGPPPYGYRTDPAHPRDPAGVRLEPAEAATVAEMFVYYQ